MITVVEPKQHIARLWGKQHVKPGETYRLMRYVLRVEHEGHVGLHNNVTGQLVLLDEQEVQVVNQLPLEYTAEMTKLIEQHYLVPEGYDEHKQVNNLRTILRTLIPKSEYITHYTILPTTACNARCYYCFEQGIKPVTMTEKTAEDVVKFIAEHCGPEKKIFITWFGGEPTVANNRIDQICQGLSDTGIIFSAKMISNGFLFDRAMVEKAKTLWNLKTIQVTFDGTEANYNKIKAYVCNSGNPYQRVMENIGLLLDFGINVIVRMNFDEENAEDYFNLCTYVSNRFGAKPNLRVVPHMVNDHYLNFKGKKQGKDEKWYDSKKAELVKYTQQCGLSKESDELPSLKYHGCGAVQDSVITIMPEGSLVKCCEQLSDEQIVGSLKEGIINTELIQKWKQLADYGKCQECTFYPLCIRAVKCAANDKCDAYSMLVHRVDHIFSSHL